MEQLKLKSKITIGYFLLIILLIVAGWTVFKEKQRKDFIDIEENRWLNTHQLRSKAFIALLDLSSISELVVGWTDEDYQLYRKKRIEVVASLQDLKINLEDATQQTCIDSICALLLAKEKHLVGIMHILDTIQDPNRILHNKRFTIHTQSFHSKDYDNTIDKQESKKRKNKLFHLFSKNSKKSAYVNQWRNRKNETEKGLTKNSSSFISLDLLKKELVVSTLLHKHQLTSLIDNLRNSGLSLDDKLEQLIYNVENKEIYLLNKKLSLLKKERENSFNIITGVIILGFITIIILYIIIHYDINQQNSYQNLLEVSSKENRKLWLAQKKILLAVSHDLRAPLSAITGYAELIPQEQNQELQKHYAEDILRISHHMIGLTNNLLFYYRLEAGKEEISKEIFHPGRIIENIVYSFRPLAIKKGLGLTMELKNMDTMIEGDCVRLTQILNNLLSNAIKFTRTGYVHVGAQFIEEQLCFFVRDTGIGISDDNQKEIFKAFEKITKERGDHGFGLGLAITTKLVTLLDGTIRVYSQLGKGSTFEVCLPMKEAHKPEIEVKSCFNLSGLKIVLVDDDKMQAEIIQRMLARNGIGCDYCHNIKELINLLRNNKYDLLLTDIQMPDIDGYRILELLRNSNLGQSKDIPVIAVTAHIDIDSASNIKFDFAGYLHKPFTMNELLTIIANCMEGRTPHIREADFTALLEGENDQKSMLDMFVNDTEITLARLREAIEKKDYKKISNLIHKGMPLWETIHMSLPVNIERLTSLSSEVWGEVTLEEVRKLIKAIESAITTAKRLKEEDIK